MLETKFANHGDFIIFLKSYVSSLNLREEIQSFCKNHISRIGNETGSIKNEDDEIRCKISVPFFVFRKLIESLHFQLEALKSAFAKQKEAKKEIEQSNSKLIEALKKADIEVRQLKTPSHQFGAFIQLEDRGDEYWVLLKNGNKFFSALVLEDIIDKFKQAKVGQWVRISEFKNYHAAIELMDRFDAVGSIATVTEKIGSRLRIRDENENETMIDVAGCIDFGKINPGNKVLVSEHGMAVEIVSEESMQDVEIQKADAKWDDIGGLDEEIMDIKNRIEMKILYPEIDALFELKHTKGILLIGPPGNGKTLIARAVVGETAIDLSKKTGRSIEGYYILINGPADVLRGIVGASPGRIKMIFDKAKRKAKEGHLVFIIFDEFEALFRQRNSQILDAGVGSEDVAQFNAEMDGVEALGNVCVFALTNRVDMVDPAVLRPGRFNRKIQINRPKTKEKVVSVFEKHLKPTVKIHSKYLTGGRTPAEVIRDFIDKTADKCLDHKSEENQLKQVFYKDEGSDIFYAADFLSCAIIAGIVEEAKLQAALRYKDASDENKAEEGLTEEDLLKSIATATLQDRNLPSTDQAMEEWLVTEGKKARNIVSIKNIYRADQDITRSSVPKRKD